MEGRRIGKWRIIRRIGTGGMSTVYEVVHKTTRFRGAMKILNREPADRPEVRERFDREASTSNAINHDGAVKVFDDGETSNGCPYLVMEYLDGETLEDKRVSLRRLLDRPRSRARRARGRGRPRGGACNRHRASRREAAQHLSREERRGEGARLRRRRPAPEQRRDEPHRPRLRDAAFMAPEQLTGAHAIDARADVFALATTMYRALTNVFPFEANTVSEFLHATTWREPRRLDDIVPDSPAGARRRRRARSLCTSGEALRGRT